MSGFASLFAKIVPPLSTTLKKGENGIVGIIGGSFEYTGAPYFAGISALKLGADVVHIFCSEGAATAIKSYSPELIVHPLFGSDKDVESTISKFKVWLPRMSSLVVGPGLGRDPHVQGCVRKIICLARDHQTGLVIDADGLSLVCEDPDLVRGYSLAVLTPNAREMDRLSSSMPDSFVRDPQTPVTATQLAQWLGNVTILQKGSVDRISDGTQELECEVGSSPRRCGGQGDVLAGSLGTLLAWALSSARREGRSPSPCEAALAACVLTRSTSSLTFSKHKRSMTTTDMIESIGEVFEKLCPAEQ